MELDRKQMEFIFVDENILDVCIVISFWSTNIIYPPIQMNFKECWNTRTSEQGACGINFMLLRNNLCRNAGGHRNIGTAISA